MNTQTKIQALIEQNSYFAGKTQVFTIPLKKSGYLVTDETLGQMIFVNSKLPKAKRAVVVKGLIQKAEVSQ